MEHSRIFSNNIASTIEEIRPFLERVCIKNIYIFNILF